MSEKGWAWLIWTLSGLLLVLLAVPTIGFTLIFLWPWWVGGPFYVTRECEVGPWWKPMAPTRPWWRDIR